LQEQEEAMVKVAKLATDQGNLFDVPDRRVHLHKQ